MNDLILLGFIVVLVAVILYLSHSKTMLIKFHHEAHLRIFEQCDKERAEWQKERQMLLDRIQAPSFAEYTNKVVREKKAEQPQEEAKPIDFIS